MKCRDRFGKDEVLVIYAGNGTLIPGQQLCGSGTAAGKTTNLNRTGVVNSKLNEKTCQHMLAEKLRAVWGQHAEVYFTIPDYTRALLRYSEKPTIAVLAGGQDPNCELLDFTLFTMSAGFNFVVVVRPPAFENVTVVDEADLGGCTVEISLEKEPLPCQVGCSRRYDNLMYTTPGVRPPELQMQIRRSWWYLNHRAEQWAQKLANNRISLLPNSKLPNLYRGSVSIEDLVPKERMRAIRNEVRRLEFDSFNYNANELLAAGFVLLQAVFRLPGLEKYRLPDGKLCWFLMVLRSSYAVHTPYHNFSHVIDVLQATVYILVLSDVLPPFADLLDSDADSPPAVPQSGLSIVDVAALVLAAPGHDIFHPGFNSKVMCNGECRFKSLEAFHATLYLQMLKQLWPAMAQPRPGPIVKEVILATDMARHNEYLDNDCDMVLPGAGSTSRQQHLYLCRVLKAADLFNAVRPFPVAFKHTLSINKEFDCQAQTEQILGLIPSPKCGGLEKDPSQGGFKEPSLCTERLKARHQFFINVFVKPLFEVMARDSRQVFLWEQLKSNEDCWHAYWAHQLTNEVFPIECCCASSAV